MDSILNQTFTNIKVIVIDDGSIDGTSNIIREYKLKDSRVFLIEKENSGIAATRNLGISLVDSKFFCFVDSDDILESNYVECMYTKAVSDASDIVFSDYNILNKGMVSKVNTYIHGGPGDYIKAMLAHGMWGVVWNKMFRTEFVIKNEIYFLDGFNFWEDLYFCISSLSHAPLISHTRTSLYNYVIRENSLVNSDVSESKVKSKIKVVEEMLSLNNINIDHKRELDAIKLHSKSEYLSSINLFSPDKWKKAVPVNTISILKAEMSMRDKVFPVLATSNLCFIIQGFLKLKSIIKSLSCK